jgi:hypothetical protein
MPLLLFCSLFSHLLILFSSNFLLSLEFAVLYFLGFLLEDGFDQHSFILELVTLRGKVKLMVNISVYLFSASVLF